MKYSVNLDLSIQGEDELKAAEAKVQKAASTYHQALRELDDTIAIVKCKMTEKPTSEEMKTCTEKEIDGLLEKQLQLLFERSKTCDEAFLAAIGKAMVETAKQLLRL